LDLDTFAFDFSDDGGGDESQVSESTIGVVSVFEELDGHGFSGPRKTRQIRMAATAPTSFHIDAAWEDVFGRMTVLGSDADALLLGNASLRRHRGQGSLTLSHDKSDVDFRQINELLDIFQTGDFFVKVHRNFFIALVVIHRGHRSCGWSDWDAKRLNAFCSWRTSATFPNATVVFIFFFRGIIPVSSFFIFDIH